MRKRWSDSLRIGRALPADSSSLAALERQNVSHWTQPLILAELNYSDGVPLLARLDEAVVGWCCARYVGDEAEVLKIAVDRDRRREGVGTMLLEALARELLLAGVRRIVLEVRAGNREARFFYRRHGFLEIGLRRNYYRQPQDDAVVYGKRIGTPGNLKREGKIMKSVRELELQDKRVLVRVDFNVPIDDDGTITDDIRIRMALPTLAYIREHGGKLIICSHLGRPKGTRDERYSLAPVAAHLGELLECSVTMAPDCVGDEVGELVRGLGPGDVLMLENLRFHDGETKNDPDFAEALAGFADVYVNDAFAVSHRAHASVAGVPERCRIKSAGLLLQQEIDYFNRAMVDPARPLVAIVGGAKVSSKLGALEKMLERVDRLIIGGAMANTFLKSQGVEVGGSLVEDDLLEQARRLIEQAEARNVKLYLPIDFVVGERFEAGAATMCVTFRDIPSDWLALDIGPATVTYFREALAGAKTIVWNGPLGAFEYDAFARGTMAVCHAVASAHALSITGGGDINAAVKKAGVAKEISYISTGGGAFLELMEGKELPGVAALNSKER